jgi:hypothetical protein
MINTNRGWIAGWKDNWDRNEPRKRRRESKILKKRVNSSFMDDFKLSPWRNKGVKEDK